MKVLLATDGSRPAKDGEDIVKALFKRDVKIHIFTVAPSSATTGWGLWTG